MSADGCLCRDVSSVTTLEATFNFATNFNQALDTWYDVLCDDDVIVKACVFCFQWAGCVCVDVYACVLAIRCCRWGCGDAPHGCVVCMRACVFPMEHRLVCM